MGRRETDFQHKAEESTKLYLQAYCHNEEDISSLNTVNRIHRLLFQFEVEVHHSTKVVLH